MIATEAEAVGKFVGDCIATSIVQAGTLISVLSYTPYTEPAGAQGRNRPRNRPI
jgi:hypothetical protein